MWDCDWTRLTRGEKRDTRMAISSEDWNVIAELEAVVPMTSSKLGKDGGSGIGICEGNDLGSD